MTDREPRAKFCWECGRKLWGNRHVLKEIDGQIRTLHKACAEKLEQEKENQWE